MSSSNNGNNSGVYPLSLYLSSVSGHQDIIPNAYNHYHQLIASPGQMASAVPNSLVNYMAFNSNNQQGSGIPEVSREVKKPVKKDRHSKIHTAQGLRDRRVRLSIGIARQFFDLQDMLGFDKASKTLDWLLNKSRKAIKKVVQAKNLNNDGQNFGNNGDNDDNEEEEEDEEEDEENDDDDDDDGHKSFVYGWSPKYYQEEALCEVMKEENRRQKRDLSNISSEGSRAKAKGKAKERRKELTYDHKETASEITQSEIIDPFQRSIIFNDGEDMTYSSYKETIEEFNNQESILTKRKINLPTNMGQNYNEQNGAYMLMDQGSSSNYNTILPHNFDYNYDQNPFVDQPFCGVTDTNFPKGTIWIQDYSLA